MSKRKLDSLERRAGFLRARVAGGEADGVDLSYDKAELSALLWAISRLQLETMEGWCSMDSAPKDMTDVLVWDGEQLWIAYQNSFGDWSAKLSHASEDGFYLTSAREAGITQWMPLPPPPQSAPPKE